MAFADREMLHRSEPGLPSMSAIGADLAHLSRRRRTIELAWPLVLVACFALTAMRGWWPAALASVVLFFPRFGVAFHDLLHSSLGLRPHTNRVWLAVIGLLALQSGHAVQRTHLAHHRYYPGKEDPEAYLGRLPLWRAVLDGPIYQYRMWAWALRHARDVRTIVIGEAALHVLIVLTAVALLPRTAIPAVYVGLILAGDSVFPALSENLLHHHAGRTPFERARTIRGPLFQAYFLELGFHLEHHAYPKVPTRNCAELARRLQPTLDRFGVTPTTTL